MKYLINYTLGLCLCTTFACSFVEDLDRIKAPEWDPEFAIALVNTTVSINDFLEKLDTGDLLETDEQTGFMKFGHRASVFSQSQAQVFTIPDTTFPMIDTLLSIPSFMGDIDHIALKGGQLSYRFESPYTGSMEVVIRLENVTQDGEVLEKRIEFPSPFTVNGAIDLADYALDFTDGTFTLYYSARTLADGKKRILPNFTMEFEHLTYRRAQGFFGQFAVDVPEETMDFSIFDKPLKEGLTLDEVQLRLIIQNSFGIPLQLEVKKLAALTASGQTIPLSNSLFVHPIDIEFPSENEIGIGRTTSILLDNTNSNIGEILSASPQSFTYAFQAIAHPSNDPLEKGFVLDNSAINAWVDMEVPLYGRIAGLEFRDTLALDLSNFDMGSYADIRLIAENGFPLDVDLQMYFMDDQFKVLDSLAGSPLMLLQAAPVDIAGVSDSNRETISDIPLSPERFARILAATKAIICAKLNSPNQGETAIRFKDTYSIGIKMGIKAGL